MFRDRVGSHKTVEAFYLYQSDQVSILEINDQCLHGIVWDQGSFYSVKIFADGQDPVIFKGAQGTISPYLTPYALAVEFKYRNEFNFELKSLVYSKKAFMYLLPHIMSIQDKRTLSELSIQVEKLFEQIEVDIRAQIYRIVINLELFHVFERYAESQIDNREFWMAMMDECMNNIDSLLSEQRHSVELSMCKMIMSNIDRRFEHLWVDKTDRLNH